MVTVKEIAWLAGIIEGEGSFAFSDNNSPRILIQMTDKDVVERVAKLFKRTIYINKPKENNWKIGYRTMVCGTAAIEWLFTIYSLLGRRRRLKANELISKWKEQQSNFSRDKFRCGCPKIDSNTYVYNRVKSCRTCILARDKARRDKKKRIV